MGSNEKLPCKHVAILKQLCISEFLGKSIFPSGHEAPFKGAWAMIIALSLNSEFSRQTAAAYSHCAEYSHKPAYSKDHVVSPSNTRAAVTPGR